MDGDKHERQKKLDGPLRCTKLGQNPQFQAETGKIERKLLLTAC